MKIIQKKSSNHSYPNPSAITLPQNKNEFKYSLIMCRRKIHIPRLIRQSHQKILSYSEFKRLPSYSSPSDLFFKVRFTQSFLNLFTPPNILSNGNLPHVFWPSKPVNYQPFQKRCKTSLRRDYKRSFEII